MTPRLGALLLFLVSLPLTGCGDGKAEISGNVTIDKVPVAQGFLTFIPMGGDAGTVGAQIKDGKYEARIMPGMMKVAVNAVPKVIGKRKLYNTPDSPETPIYGSALPPRYASMEESELRVDVKPGKNEKDFDLPSK